MPPKRLPPLAVLRCKYARQHPLEASGWPALTPPAQLAASTSSPLVATALQDPRPPPVSTSQGAQPAPKRLKRDVSAPSQQRAEMPLPPAKPPGACARQGVATACPAADDQQQARDRNASVEDGATTVPKPSCASLAVDAQAIFSQASSSLAQLITSSRVKLRAAGTGAAMTAALHKLREAHAALNQPAALGDVSDATSSGVLNENDELACAGANSACTGNTGNLLTNRQRAHAVNTRITTLANLQDMPTNQLRAANMSSPASALISAQPQRPREQAAANNAQLPTAPNTPATPPASITVSRVQRLFCSLCSCFSSRYAYALIAHVRGNHNATVDFTCSVCSASYGSVGEARHCVRRHVKEAQSTRGRMADARRSPSPASSDDDPAPPNAARLTATSSTQVHSSDEEEADELLDEATRVEPERLSPPPLQLLSAHPPARASSMVMTARVEEPDADDDPAAESSTATGAIPLKTHRRFATRFNDSTDAATLVAAISEYSSLLISNSVPPSAREGAVRPHGPHRSFKIDDMTVPHNVRAQKIQRMYEYKPKKAFRLIDEDESPSCALSAQAVEQHFQPASVDQDVQGLPSLPPFSAAALQEANSLAAPCDGKEVAAVLASANLSSAPGPSGLSYTGLKRVASMRTLAAMLNAVLRLSVIPDDWKRSRLVLIHKKGDPKLPRNWRPLALQEILPKLLAGLLSRRLLVWLKRHEVLPRWQRAFLGTDGCAECAFVLDAARDYARRKRTLLCLAWIDVSNAFGSVPHARLLESLKRRGLPESFIRIIENMYRDSTLLYREPNGKDVRIPERMGLKQGCPLSPLLFDIYSAPLLEALTGVEAGAHITDSVQVEGSAFADDLLALGRSIESLQLSLKKVNTVARALRLSINGDKSRTIVLDYKKGRVTPEVRDHTFVCGMARLSPLKLEDQVIYLGKPFSADRRPEAGVILAGVVRSLRRVEKSLLKPWQKLRAIQMFILPRLNYCMRVFNVASRNYDNIGSELRKVVRTICNLPLNSSQEYIYAPRLLGGLGFSPLTDLRAAAIVAHCARLLDSDSSAVSDVARECMQEVTRTGTMHDAIEAIHACRDVRGRRCKLPAVSIWSRLRKAVDRLNMSIAVELRWADGRLQCWVALHGQEPEPIRPDKLYRDLRAVIDAFHADEWKSQPYAGHAAPLISRDKSSVHFIRTGEGISFSDWRFIHSARLSCTSVRALRLRSGGDTRCRLCGFPFEDLQHILNHCKHHTLLCIRRHDAILIRLTRAVLSVCCSSQDALTDATEKLMNREGIIKPSAHIEIYVNHSHPTYCKKKERPDFIIIDNVKRTAFIIDVNVPFERDADSFKKAAAIKFDTYADTAKVMRRSGLNASVHAFLIGSLGSWSPDNWKTLRALGLSSSHIRSLAKCCVSETIGWSNDIYLEHLFPSREPDLHYRTVFRAKQVRAASATSTVAPPGLPAARANSATAPSGAPALPALLRPVPPQRAVAPLPAPPTTVATAPSNPWRQTWRLPAKRRRVKSRPAAWSAPSSSSAPPATVPPQLPAPEEVTPSLSFSATHWCAQGWSMQRNMPVLPRPLCPAAYAPRWPACVFAPAVLVRPGVRLSAPAPPAVVRASDQWHWRPPAQPSPSLPTALPRTPSDP